MEARETVREEGAKGARMHLCVRVCVCVCTPAYLYGAQFVLLFRVVVDHRDKVVADVSLLVAAALITLPVGH